MKYELIYADPPWTYRDKAKAGARGAESKYGCMTLEEICNLPVQNIAADNSLLAMWWVGPQPVEALTVVEAWGFQILNMTGFTWHKLTKTGKSHFGMGHLTRGNCENVLFAVRGKKPKRADAGVRQFIEAPYRGHSVKPWEVRAALVRLLGDIPRIELFARDKIVNGWVKTPGWDKWGDELDDSIDLFKPPCVREIFEKELELLAA